MYAWAYLVICFSFLRKENQVRHKFYVKWPIGARFIMWFIIYQGIYLHLTLRSSIDGLEGFFIFILWIKWSSKLFFHVLISLFMFWIKWTCNLHFLVNLKFQSPFYQQVRLVINDFNLHVSENGKSGNWLEKMIFSSYSIFMHLGQPAVVYFLNFLHGIGHRLIHALFNLLLNSI